MAGSSHEGELRNRSLRDLELTVIAFSIQWSLSRNELNGELHQQCTTVTLESVAARLSSYTSIKAPLHNVFHAHKCPHYAKLTILLVLYFLWWRVNAMLHLITKCLLIIHVIAANQELWLHNIVTLQVIGAYVRSMDSCFLSSFLFWSSAYLCTSLNDASALQGVVIPTEWINDAEIDIECWCMHEIDILIDPHRRGAFHASRIKWTSNVLTCNKRILNSILEGTEMIYGPLQTWSRSFGLTISWFR